MGKVFGGSLWLDPRQGYQCGLQRQQKAGFLYSLPIVSRPSPDDWVDSRMVTGACLWNQSTIRPYSSFFIPHYIPFALARLPQALASAGV